MPSRLVPLLAALAALFAACANNQTTDTSASASPATSVAAFAKAVGDGVEVRPLLSVGDTVPETSDDTVEYRMVGLPDGLGLHENVLYMNHELTPDVVSEPEVGKPRYRGAFVSAYKLDDDGAPASGGRAYDEVFNENKLVGPAPTTANKTPAFARFCSGSLASQEHGLDRPIYFTNEESGGKETFGGKGGVTVAIFDNELHTLPRLGRFSKENSVVMPDTGDKTVIMTLEDGEEGLFSELYMYVGTKDDGSDSVLRKNGLDNGTLYTFAAPNTAKNDEKTVTSGSVDGSWKEIPGAEDMTDVQLAAATTKAKAFRFNRIEDGAFSKTEPGRFFFVSTGGSAKDGNALGRLYTIEFDTADPTADSTLEIVFNSDTIVADGDDIAMSPDNIDVSEDALLISEDATDPTQVVLKTKQREAGIWHFPLDDGTTVDVDERELIVELTPPGRDKTAVDPGTWETSGTLDASETFGAGTWLFDVQAHDPTKPPKPTDVEDGQLLMLTAS